MENPTIETILSVFKNTRDSKKLKDIKNDVVAKLSPTEILDAETESKIHKEVERLIKLDAQNGDASYLLKLSNSKYKKRPNRKAPIDATCPIDTNYIGKAGECAVLSELMFRGYNANVMLIDEGIDIIAEKNNVYYYIQVKTAYIQNARIYTRIKKETYTNLIDNQVRYIIVARTGESNMFFVFNSTDIDRLKHDRCINVSEDFINVKIKFDGHTGKPIIYDEKEQDISYYTNKFNL